VALGGILEVIESDQRQGRAPLQLYFDGMQGKVEIRQGDKTMTVSPSTFLKLFQDWAGDERDRKLKRARNYRYRIALSSRSTLSRPDARAPQSPISKVRIFPCPCEGPTFSSRARSPG
jgi:hypothetical protein